MKLIVLFVLVGVVVCEPPPPSSYLPPQARRNGGYSTPSQQYGAPSFNTPAGNAQYTQRRPSGNGFGASSRFSAAASAQQYNAPAPSLRYNAPAPAQRYNAPAPAQRYNAPAPAQRYNAPAPAQRYNAPAPAQSYSAPAQQYNAPAPAPRYSAPSASQFRAPSSQYGAPRSQQPSQQYGVPSTEYGVPNGKSAMDDDLAEPANYDFSYEVQGSNELEAEFGHQETREDEFARGEYHVLLPDGRLQIVEYEADEEGFRPKIRYEETGAGGYPDSRGAQGPY